jgi:hypothetical protein
MVAAAALLANAMMVACAGHGGYPAVLLPRAKQPEGPARRSGLGLAARAGDPRGLGLLRAAAGLADPAARGADGAGGRGQPMPIYLALWHGVNRALMLSLATFALGIGST